ncbi:MAG: AAA family ATPase [Roseovarius sp.]|nr:AAA family ATPase [Roseovarius sp.]
MPDFEQQYALWDEFLSVWPASRLASMTLDEYTQAGSQDSFTYWIESRLDKMGSIWGGSAFKFGVFSRKSTESKPSDAKLSYSNDYAWYSTLGDTADEAFEKVRGFVVQVAELAQKGDLDAIDAFKNLGEVFKWKIAFHYQDRQAPIMVNIFRRDWLAAFGGDTEKSNMATLQNVVMAKRPVGQGILEYGQEVWEAGSKKLLKIWKLSHGVADFSSNEWEAYLEKDLGVMHGETGKGQGKDFQKAEVGSLFYLCHGNEEVVLIGQFTSAAEPCEKGDGWLQRHYRVLKQAIKKGAYEGTKKGWTPNYNSTFKRIGTPDLPEFEAALLQPFFELDLGELAAVSGEPLEPNNLGNGQEPSFASVPTKVLASEPVAACINRIYYGPPGTGKTYALTQLLKSDYEQEVESISADAWRNQIIAEKIGALTWWEGLAAALYDLGGQAKVPELAGHRFIQAIADAKSRVTGINQTLWGTLQDHTVLDSTTVNVKQRLGSAIFDKSADSIWRFAGDWDEIGDELRDLVDELKAGPKDDATVQRYSFVTFHQSYGYEEFVEGLRPVLAGDTEEGEVAYEIRPGAFKELCRKARQAPDQRWAMVIDEINRGNISKIFGEMITLIEADKRDRLDGSPPSAEVTLAYSGEKFTVPANVDIIGTMNTADRSLALLDTALRRRFDFVPLMPDTRAEKVPAEQDSAPLAGLVVKTETGVIDVRLMLERINERIEALYDRDHCIGHAYFTGLAKVQNDADRFLALAATFRNRILPLMEEYFFEDWRKIRLVLADNQKANAADQFIRETADHDQDLSELFGNDHGLDSYATRQRYSLQESAFRQPMAYIGIYNSHS